MRTTTIQIARILRDAMPPADLARVAEAIESYLIDNDPEAAGLPDPTLARRTDVAGDLLDRIETHMRDDGVAALADDTEAEPEHETSFTGYKSGSLAWDNEQVAQMLDRQGWSAGKLDMWFKADRRVDLDGTCNRY